jgi:DNA-binding NarL/FixJ family response regulator
LPAGAAAFLLTMGTSPRLVDPVRVVADVAAPLVPGDHPTHDRWVADAPSPGREPPQLAEATAREPDVLTLIAPRLGNAEIAVELYFAEGTVTTPVAPIRKRLSPTCPGSPH